MKPNRDAILLSKVQSLTLRGGSPPPLTTHRRVSAIPQLTCISSPQICALHTIETLRCTNQGSGYDSEDIQWSCVADLPSELKLGSTDVICEGYSRADDPYILKGSCGVEYRLALTESGEAKWPDLAKGGNGGWGGSGKDGERDPSAWLFGVIFIAVAVWILYSACTAPRRNAGRRALGNGGGRRGGGGGGGGGWGPGGGGGGGGDDNWNDPPPPYPGNNKSSYNTQPRAGQGQQQQGWRPGFWSGILGGAAAGYMAGGRNNTRNNNNRNYGGTGGGWGGNSGGWGGSSTSSSRSNSSGSASGPSYESTGFGGTSRR